MTTMINKVLLKLGMEKPEENRGGMPLPWREKEDFLYCLRFVGTFPAVKISMEARRFADPKVGR